MNLYAATPLGLIQLVVDQQPDAGTGYAVASLEAELWCFNQTETFDAAVLLAANLGEDADTTEAIVGQIARAHYGIDAVPKGWRARLHLGAEIESLARQLGSAHQNAA